MTLGSATIPLLLGYALFSALVTWLSIRYAYHRALVDMPGQRRSHSVPTPRGGGIGIVVTVLLGLSLSPDHYINLLWESPIVPVLLVASVGWIDDHRGLRAIWRLLAHFFAIVMQWWPAFLLIVVWPWAIGAASTQATMLHIALMAAIWVACVWSINLHNFMDGINGLLAAQAIFIFTALSVLSYGQDRFMLQLFASAVAGFLPFNFPRARVFMGDVGSGVLGLLIAIAVWQSIRSTGSAYSGLIACSAFVTDATCTLLSRMLRGRRWYSAHREHLYQWLVRSGFSHARVVAFYMGWNLFVVVPVLYAVNRGAVLQSQFDGWVWMLAVYALAFAVWIAGKRWCLLHAKNAKKQEV
jgi:UDP-N-acetylmuramyl pentapeptide phosphotransferase/UDP-N-acetylglucosamine-1-phosphate transferase